MGRKCSIGQCCWWIASSIAGRPDWFAFGLSDGHSLSEEVNAATPTDAAAGSAGQRDRARDRLRFHRRVGLRRVQLLPWPGTPRVPPIRGIRLLQSIGCEHLCLALASQIDRCHESVMLLTERGSERDRRKDTSKDSLVRKSHGQGNGGVGRTS